jgi:putative sigma-54 modulation protein
MMEVKVKSKDVELTPALFEYAQKRFKSLEHFYKDIEDKSVTIELGKVSDHHRQGNFFKVSAHTHIRSKTMHASSTKADLYTAIDDVRDELVREIESGQGRYRALMLRGARKIKGILRAAYPFGKR